MPIHTALKDLPSILANMGFNVEVADGYLEGQGNYLWTDPDTGVGSYDGPPSGYMVHHTAGSAATPPPADTSKAGAWTGLWRDGRLYQFGGGIPTIYLATAGPARISSGFGYRPALWDFTFQDVRAPTRAQGNDGSTAGNRYTFNVETVHRGDGSALDRGVWDCDVGIGIALQQMFGWTERTLGHLSWSKRKIDPKWSVGMPHDGADCIIDVQDAIANKPPSEDFVYTTWANGMFDNYSDQDIDDLTDAGLISPPSSYWKTMRDNTNRSASQQQEVARFIQAAVVSAQVNTALP